MIGNGHLWDKSRNILQQLDSNEGDKEGEDSSCESTNANNKYSFSPNSKLRIAWRSKRVGCLTPDESFYYNDTSDLLDC